MIILFEVFVQMVFMILQLSWAIFILKTRVISTTIIRIIKIVEKTNKHKTTQQKNKQQQNKNKPVRGTDIVLASKFCCIIWCVSSVLFLPGWLAKFGYLSIVSQNWRLTSLLRKITDQWIYLWNSSPKYKNIRCFGFIFLYIYLT